MAATTTVSRTVLASAARTTTQAVERENLDGHRGIRVTLDVTEIAATPSLTLKIEYYDQVSGKWVVLLTGAAVTTVSTNTYEVFPGAPVTANVSANKYLSRKYKITVTAADADSATYSVGEELLH